MKTSAEKEWLLALDWNNPMGLPGFKVFHLFGVSIMWDEYTWCFQFSLALIVIRFGHVYSR